MILQDVGISQATSLASHRATATAEDSEREATLVDVDHTSRPESNVILDVQLNSVSLD